MISARLCLGELYTSTKVRGGMAVAATKSTQRRRRFPLSPETKSTAPRMNPGDQAPAGTPGTGENICPKCGGKGSLQGKKCEHCGGTGKVIEGVGGA
jgi:hypothetical protein